MGVKRIVNIGNLIQYNLRKDLEYLLGFSIPKGLHIHHIDKNRSNNSIDNLALITSSNHKKLHPSWFVKVPTPRVECIKMRVINNNIELYDAWI